MTVSQWFIVVFSMVMLTARIAFYENTRLGLVAGSNHENSLHKDGKKGDVMSNGACETGKEEEEVINTFAMEPLTAPAHHSNGACEIGKEEEEIINTFAMEPAPSSASPDLKVELKEEYVRNC